MTKVSAWSISSRNYAGQKKPGYFWRSQPWPGVGIAQKLVQRQTDKPGGLYILLTGVRFPGAARDFCPRVSFQCTLYCSVRAALRVQSHASTSAHVISPKHWQPYQCLETRKCCVLVCRYLAASHIDTLWFNHTRTRPRPRMVMQFTSWWHGHSKPYWKKKKPSHLIKCETC